MKEIQSSLTKKFSENNITNMLMQFAAILLYVYAGYRVLSLIMSFVDEPSKTIYDILNFVGIFAWYAYLIGLIFCFAKNNFTPILTVFAIKALAEIIGFIRYITGDYTTFITIISYLVDVAVYCLLTFGAYTQFAKTRVVAGFARPMGAAPATKFCPSCGKQVPADAPFCNNCGNKLM
ncbi:MAG: zinc ribbon domain-containing protein [Ruminococcaceae bacterium]|nr:zinc ribbon domain-containing protein [Oscillospiraceae bacterium]